MIAVIDSGLGNAAAVENMLHRIRVQVQVLNRPGRLAGVHALILPGVGAFDQGMRRLEETGFRAMLDDWVQVRRQPTLGICLGMQLMTRASEEGSVAGLGWVPADTRRIDVAAVNAAGLRVPHMGWSAVSVQGEGARLIAHGDRFYFAHGYQVVCDRPDDVWATVVHGVQFVAAFRSGNCFGVQFHPEKSHRFGLGLFRRFAEMVGCPARA